MADAGQPRLDLQFGARDPVSAHIRLDQSTMLDEYARHTLKHPLRARRQIGDPAQRDCPKCDRANGERRTRQAEIIMGDALLDKVAHHDQQHQFEGCDLAQLPRTQEAVRSELRRSTRSRRTNWLVHQGSRGARL